MGCGGGASRLRPPKPPSARQNVVCVDGREQVAARLVDDLALRIDQRAPALALVDHIEDARPARSPCPRGAIGACSAKPLLAVHDMRPGDAELRPAES